MFLVHCTHPQLLWWSIQRQLKLEHYLKNVTHTEITVNMRLSCSVLPMKMSGITKQSSDISSSRLFCSGVPVNSSRRYACKYTMTNKVLLSTTADCMPVNKQFCSSVPINNSRYACSIHHHSALWIGFSLSVCLFVYITLFMSPQSVHLKAFMYLPELTSTLQVTGRFQRRLRDNWTRFSAWSCTNHHRERLPLPEGLNPQTLYESSALMTEINWSV